MGYNPPRRQRIGNLRDRITWQENVGESGERWEDRETEPARVEPLKGNEQFAGNEMIARQNLRVFARYRRVPDTARWRVVWWTGHVVEGVQERLVCDILAASNPDERRRYVELLCENTNTRSDPPNPEPGEGSGELQNPGNPFTSTQGWTAIVGEVGLDFGWGTQLRIGGWSSALAVSPISTSIGVQYRVTAVVGEYSDGSAVVAGSNNADGSAPLEESDPIAPNGSDAITFEATETTTYVVIRTTSSGAQFVSIVSERVP